MRFVQQAFDLPGRAESKVAFIHLIGAASPLEGGEKADSAVSSIRGFD
jgi:hypothetical protein